MQSSCKYKIHREDKCNIVAIILKGYRLSGFKNTNLKAGRSAIFKQRYREHGRALGHICIDGLQSLLNQQHLSKKCLLQNY